MELFEEIKSNWKLDIYNKMQQIESLKNSYPAWTIKTFEGYGVAVLYNGDDVREDFSNAAIYCEQIDMNGENHKVLVLSSKSSSMDSPAKWWAMWKELLGNKSIDERVYDVIGELAVLRYYAQKGLNPKWNGPNQSSYDIELDDSFVEVKSSINRTKKEITISSIYQLSNLNKKLYLTFCTFELTTGQGESINSLVKDLRLLGYNIATINEALEKKGFGVGKSDRNKTFILHSMYQYLVEEKFPKVTEQSCINGALPSGIIDISYTVD